MSLAETQFYFVGGAVPNDVPSYIARRADDDLLAGLRRGQFCYVLTSRQMGKSSLMVRTVNRLRQEGATCIVLDLTALGQNLAVERWYDGLLNMMGWQLGLEDELDEFWCTHDRLSPLQRFTRALHEVVLKRVAGPVILFVDEVDAVRSLPFSVDEFFAGIRECYNHRAEDPEFARLTFALFGVASPSDLIRDTRTTPFNIGQRIELTDFTPAEAEPLAAGLRPNPLTPFPKGKGELNSGSSPFLRGMSGSETERRGIGLLSRVLYWTGGHPYLTQRLCQAVAEQIVNPKSRIENPKSLVDRLCEEMFLSRSARERDDNLIFVRERLLRSEADTAGLLTLYGQVWAGNNIPDNETNPLVSVLKLSGIVRAENGRLCVRNRIYGRVFDRPWIRMNMPGTELLRQRVAYRTGALRATAVAAALLLIGGGMAMVAISQARRAQSVSARLNVARKQLEIALRDALQQRDRANREAKNADAARGRETTRRKEAQQARVQADGQRQAAVRAKVDALRQGELAKRQGELARREGKRATRAEQATRAQLRLSYLALAQAQRFSGRPGLRFRSRELLARAAAMQPDPELRLKLRDEAIACLALPVDLRPQPGGHYSHTPLGAGACGVDLAHHRIFVADAHGGVCIQRRDNRAEIARLPDIGRPVYCYWKSSPDGRYASLLYHLAAGRVTNVVWDVRRCRQMLRSDDAYKTVDFSPDSHSLSYSNGDRVVHLLNLATGVEVGRIVTDDAVTVTRFSPDCRRLAGSCEDSHIYVWDAGTGEQLSDLATIATVPQTVVFSHRGDLLASSGWGHFVRLWDTVTGRQLLVIPVGADMLQFSPDDRSLALTAVNGVSIHELSVSQAYRVLSGKVENIFAAEFSRDGRIQATAGDEVTLWDTAACRLIGTLPTGHIDTVIFTSDGTGLITYGPNGIQRWPVLPGASASQQLIGPPVQLDYFFHMVSNRLCLSRDEKIAAVIRGSNAIQIIPLTGKSPPFYIGEQAGASYIACSGDGRWVASGAWQGYGVKAWDVSRRKLAHEFAIPYQASVAFHPNGKWLVTGTQQEYRFWKVGSWEPGPAITRPVGAASPCIVAFGPDGAEMAVAMTDTQVHLCDAVTGRKIVALESPTPETIVWLSFSPDGSRLAAACASGKIQLWDLERLHRELAQIGLGWGHGGRAPDRQAAPLKLTALPAEGADGYERVMQRYNARIVAVLRGTSHSAPSAGVLPPAYAAEDLRIITARFPEYAYFCDRLAWAYVSRPARLNEPARALPYAMLATRLQPHNPAFWHTLAVAYYRLGQLDRAMAAWQEDLKQPGSEETAVELFFFAMMYQRQRQAQQARSCYDRAQQWWRNQRFLCAPLQADLAAARTEAAELLQLSSADAGGNTDGTSR